ncbi:hypothetical protein IC757_08330 [Wenzhouxiangella sp. AB-CW3]|uniref:hypothetical protein n=1 Tax=Wenzhouxiangella sp. AB-CW3 TaxID=2771012 RepID=UPI00168AD120|nr:hypothetical protein [Wenzhouxiangella sp. AB-CW3]QOC24093.1 hypothetical protein IC757_08330 [Wenzhouxiangella sp. AB-CW3]
MRESEIHEFILTQLFELYAESVPSGLCPSQEFNEAVGPVLPRVLSYLHNLELGKEELAEIAYEYYATYDQRIPLHEKTENWQTLGGSLRAGDA